ncbi:putative L-lactate dehydrogenase [Aspergillus flavus]|uniref:L-lactate dehydrogenase (cytochrome) n=1 Tax=Aspergillus flavus (strain ATCC 200026 / FGSC A1120 / IAM 13836 / NRRL 3357 / JCM 12722 / SRRC 167) TaxID=332952 RepID=A0A7U2QYL3_ASPFN|nr:putative L-lactate dehydrogenase [Aspergillus flavus]
MAPMDMSRENSPQPQEENSSGLVTVPMRNLYELTRLKNLRVNAGWRPNSSLIQDDFISQGVVTLAEAEYLFDRFMRINNRLLWDGILPFHHTLDSVRRASTLLAAVVLTIGALHTPGKTEAFHQSYDVFVSLVCGSSLSRNHSVDDVRALCIGAFYLANLSWKLSGQATRIAAEIGLHQSYQKLIQGDNTQRDRVCLWYATYVCDHQFSIAHGRPPAAVDDESIRNIERFMHTTEVHPGDARLAAQVALFAILTEAYVAFGNELDRPLEDKDFDKLWVSNVAIDQWRLHWQPRSKDCAALGSYPSKALVLYYHFARFQLNSLALRGINPSGLTSNPELTSKSPLSLAHREAANAAIAAATSTLTLILEDDDLRRAFPGVPIFTYTMVAFCATFLLKMAATWGKTSTQFGLATVSSKPPLESILNTYDFEKVASQELSRKTWAFYSSAATDMITRDANKSMYDRILLRPRVLRNVNKVNTQTTILGCETGLPLFVSPAAMAKMVHPDGELAIARGCAKYGVGQCISTNASYTVSDITACAPGHPFFFQLYINRDRAASEQLLRRVEKSGIKAVFLTVDAPVAGKREADERVGADASEIIYTAPMTGAQGVGDAKGSALGRTMGRYIDASFTWEDLKWLRRSTSLPIVLKGIQTAEDALMATEHGVDGIVVSNHGGRSVDTSTSSIAVLMEIRQCCPQVFEHLEVFVDGGIRRGTDIFKAICLGAKAVGMGRQFLYSLTYGQEGVERLIEIMKDELETTMKLLGITDLSQAHPGLLNTLDVDHLIPKRLGESYSGPVVKARL